MIKRIKKLNNKGMTAVEVLVCFVLVVVISMSMYSSVAAYQNKQHIEAFKEKINTYKNLLTKEINDDLIKDGLVSAKIMEQYTDPLDGDSALTIELYMRNGEKNCLKVKSVRAYDYFWETSMESELPQAEDKDDVFLISYGICGSETQYPIPNLGFGYNPNGKLIYDLRINNVSASIENSVLSVYVGFYHPELGTRYGIDIVCPINF